MDANCGLWNAHCSVYKVSLAFKWLIVFRSAMKTRDQTHRVLNNAFPRPETRAKRTFARLVRRLILRNLLV